MDDLCQIKRINYLTAKFSKNLQTYIEFYKDRNLSGLRKYLKTQEKSNRYIKSNRSIKSINEKNYKTIIYNELVSLIYHDILNEYEAILHAVYQGIQINFVYYHDLFILVLYKILEYLYEIINDNILPFHIYKELNKIIKESIVYSPYKESILIMLNKLNKPLRYEWIRLVCAN